MTTTTTTFERKTRRQLVGWNEIVFSDDTTRTSSLVDADTETIQAVAQRIQKGESLLLLEPIVTTTTTNVDDNKALSHLFSSSSSTNPEEDRLALIRDCLVFADTTEPSDFETAGRRRLPTVEAASRAAGSCDVTPLPDDLDERVQAILVRIFDILDTQCPVLVQTLFRKDDNDDESTANKTISLRALLDDEELEFASREPAINIYRDGGDFEAHEDDQTLTVLVSLSQPDDEYTGGGTAFWSHAASRSRNLSSSSGDNKALPPTLVVRPPAATVLLFGGTVTHAARPVLSGCRVVFVASFSRRWE